MTAIRPFYNKRYSISQVFSLFFPDEFCPYCPSYALEKLKNVPYLTFYLSYFGRSKSFLFSYLPPALCSSHFCYSDELDRLAILHREHERGRRFFEGQSL